MTDRISNIIVTNTVDEEGITVVSDRGQRVIVVIDSVQAIRYLLVEAYNEVRRQ